MNNKEQKLQVFYYEKYVQEIIEGIEKTKSGTSLDHIKRIAEILKSDIENEVERPIEQVVLQAVNELKK